LPEKYRLPIVCCDLEGLTRDQAANRLSWPPGTVAGRLVRGRALLQTRLLRRGLDSNDACPAALLAAMSSLDVPTRELDLLSTGARAARTTGNVGSSASAKALDLAQGALRTMWWTKLKHLGAVVVGASLLACTTVGLVRLGAGQVPAIQPPAASSPGKQPAASATSTKPAATSSTLAAQTTDSEIKGGVVDTSGKPSAGVSVLLYLEYLGQAEPVLASTKTDGQGQFVLAMPRLRGPGRARTYNGNRSHLFVYRPGSALEVSKCEERPRSIVLRESAPRTVIMQQADGKPVAGARVMPRVVHVFNDSLVEIPPSLATQLAATTGPDGKATLTSMAARDELTAVRIAGDSLAGQDIMLVDRWNAATRTGPATATIQTTSLISGRIVDERGLGVPGQAVEVWSRGGLGFYPCPVEFAGGPVRTGVDGSFRTPPGLLAGSIFRIVVRAPGKDLIVGDWITLGEKPSELPATVLSTLRTLRGRVVDRVGKPVAGAEVLQRGDGPEWTSTHTDAKGLFSLGGFRSGAVIVFARHERFRFHGQLVKPAEGEVTVVLTRRAEPPDREMKPLPYPDMPADSPAIARHLIEPVVEMALQRKDTQFAEDVLTNLAVVDPGAALEKLDSAKLLDAPARIRVRLAVIEQLVRTDPEEAAGVAEAIPDASLAAHSLLLIVKTLPADRRQTKLELLDRALLRARAANGVGQRLRYTAAVADTWCELGEVEKARKLLTETLPVANQYTKKTDTGRGFFAASLARFDLPAAMAIANEFSGERKNRILGVMAIQLAATNPAEAERLWNEARPTLYRESLEVCWGLAASDPARARRVAAKAAEQGDSIYYIVLAHGLVSRDKAAARAALQQGLDQVEQIMDDQQSGFRVRGFLELAMEVVGQIDPALTADVFWRYLSTRSPCFDPRLPTGPSLGPMIRHVAMYDRELARILLTTIRARRSHAVAPEPTELQLEYDAWTVLDPSGAIAAIEKLPVNPDRLDRSSHARIWVATTLTCKEGWGFRRRTGTFGFLPQP